MDREAALTYGIDLSSYSINQSLIVNGGGSEYGEQAPPRPPQVSSLETNWVQSILLPGVLPFQASHTTRLPQIREQDLAKPQIRASEGQQVTVRLVTAFRSPCKTQLSLWVETIRCHAVFSTTGHRYQHRCYPTSASQQGNHSDHALRTDVDYCSRNWNIPPTIGNRTVNTVIRLKDGETNLLAGLLRRDERKSLTGLPGISKIPLIRDLFASNQRKLEEKDIVFTIHTAYSEDSEHYRDGSGTHLDRDRRQCDAQERAADQRV